jgi:hypothetical protein
MFTVSILLAFGGGSRSFDQAPLSVQIVVIGIPAVISLIYWICKRGKSD